MADVTPVGGGIGGFLGKVRAFLRGAAPGSHMPRDEIEAHLLAHLTEHGRATTGELYRLFHAKNMDILTKRTEDSGYVSLASVFVTLQDLEDREVIFGKVEHHEGRDQVFWSLDPWSGTRNRAKGLAKAEARSGIVAAAIRRDALH